MVKLLSQINGLLLLLALLLIVSQCRGQQSRRQYAEIIASHSQQQLSQPRRKLQLVSNFTSDGCTVCNGFSIQSNATPPPYDLEGVPSNLTCDELDSLFRLYLPVADYSCSIVHDMFRTACCQITTPPYECEQNVRSILLENYDSSIVPLSQDTNTLQVELVVDILHISEISTTHGISNVFVWFHLKWNDPRLAWTVSQTNCTSSFTARASVDYERTELNVPDVDLLNQVNGGVQAFPDAMATVYNDGTVVWRRNGGLKAFCFFNGLNRFPFDTLGCAYIVGPWVRDTQIEITLGGPNNTGWTAGESLDQVIYNEYTLEVDRTESGYYALPSKGYVYFNLYFERSSRYYVLKVLLPTMVFTILGFGVFFLDLRVGERLTYGLTVLLVIIAQDISNSQLLPITDQRLWINTFVVGSFYWTLFCNLESVFVAWLYFIGDEEHFDNLKSRASSLATTNEAGDSPTEKVNVDNDKETTSLKRMVKDNDEEQSGAYDTGSNLHDTSSPDEYKAVSFQNDDDDVMDESQSSPKTGRNGAAAATDRRAGFARAATQRVLEPSRRLLTFRQLLMQRNQPTKKRHQTIRRIDMWAFWILSVSYLLFVIVMFATNSLWDDGNVIYTQGSESNYTKGSS